MELKLNRHYLGDSYTIGKLYINGDYFCDTLENKVRDLNKNGRFDNGERKIPKETAIPYGTFLITLKEISPKYSNFTRYPNYKFCGGRLPRLLDVSDFIGILIHIGNFPKDTEGCILVGYNTIKGQVTNSTDTFKRLYKLLEAADKKGEIIKITIY